LRGLSALDADTPGSGSPGGGVASGQLDSPFALKALLHELGHAVVARGDGVGVDGVTLWMFGGVARLRSRPPTAAAEARIALAGPAATGLTAGGFWLMAALADGGGRPSMTVAMFDWLSRTNLMLLALNLLPALPLDGGRVLGATVWGATGRRHTGETWAARAGWLIGGGLGIYGLLALRDDRATGTWALVVALFVLGASFEHERRDHATAALEGYRVGDVMRADPPVVDSWMSVDALLRHVAGRADVQRHDVFPVRDPAGAVVGVVRLANALAVPEVDRPAISVQALTEPRRDVPVVGVDEPLLEVMADHPELQHGTVMVVDPGGRVVGVLGPDCLGRH